MNAYHPKRRAFAARFGQLPLTRFKDYPSSIEVKLVKHDDPAAMLRGTFDFVKATWSEDGLESERATPEQMQFALEQMLSGKALGLGLETVNLMFRIRGISRIDTHQIVRQRVGVTFSQQCSGDRFWTHHDCLVEPSIFAYTPLYLRFRQATLDAKCWYADACDSAADAWGVSIQAARSMLPHNLETFILMNTNLSTLLFFHQKRIDDGSQTWQINEVARQMAAETCRVFPSLEPVFERNSRRFKFQKDASADRHNNFSTGLYLPDPDDYDYHDRDYLYPHRKRQMHLEGPPSRPYKKVRDSYFWGHRQVSLAEYGYIAKRYAEHDAAVQARPELTNRSIYHMAREVNERIVRELCLNSRQLIGEE